MTVREDNSSNEEQSKYHNSHIASDNREFENPMTADANDYFLEDQIIAQKALLGMRTHV